MIPILAEHPTQHPSTAPFLDALLESGFAGDIDRSAAARLAVATDNSVYQVLPDAVILPKSADDVVRIARLMAMPTHHDVRIVARGGGTGTNGQSLSPGIVVDVSRHMTEIIEFDAVRGVVRVQPGVVLDDLNRHVRSAGWFFGPTLSPSNRATLGGMISTNASGKGSRVYGRTADHVVELDVVLVDGTRLLTRRLSIGEARARARCLDREGQIYATLLATIETHRDAIESKWPDMPRTLTGYDLKHAVNQDQSEVSLNPILAGSEGTLGFIVAATLRLLPVPKAKRTIALAYSQFEHALAAAETLVQADPSAIETIDGRILELAKNDAIWHKVSHLLTFGVDVRAVNLLEFVGEDAASISTKIAALTRGLASATSSDERPIGIVVTETDEDAAALWELRKKGVGLLGALRGDRRPIAFVEDTAVPPKRLREYVREFRQILDDAGLIYGMFGHVDVGCLHVRPALNLRDPADEQRMRHISDRVMALVKRYGGVFWGEHGKGFRSEYVPEFFGRELFHALCRIKQQFDPHGQLNPGKLAVVPGSTQRLVSIDGPTRGAQDRQIAPETQQRFDVAIHCNGNGQCFTTDPDSVMCPSSKWRRDRVHSPKGRAALIREWLRQLSRNGYDAGAELRRAASADSSREPGLASLIESVDQRQRFKEYDFSHEVYDALDGCLSCKACSTQCPIKVDIPRMKSEFLSLYHRRYRRPLRDYFVAALEWVLTMLSPLPRFFNWWMRRGWVKLVLRRWVGIVDVPPLSAVNLRRELNRRNASWLTEPLARQLRELPERDRKQYVILLQDAFTTFYEPQVAIAAHDLIVRLGYVPLLVPFFPNGKALVIKGFLSLFRRLARRNSGHLNRLASLGIPMVGIEPAVTLTYREEYPEHLGIEAIQFEVLLIQDWLDSHCDRIRDRAATSGPDSGTPVPLLFGHCTERTASPLSQKAWARVFTAAGLKLELADVGCCGMCGVFGYESNHVAESRGIYRMSWKPKLTNVVPGRVCLATGHSCRSQVERIDAIKLRHPIELLLEQVTPQH